MSVKVRYATVMDVERLAELGRDFHAESPYSQLPYSETAVAQFALAGLQSEQQAIFVAEKDGAIIGAAGVAMTRFYFTADQFYATELFWFVASEHRGGSAGMRLLRAMEIWAAAKGCKFLTVISFKEKAPRHYLPLETSYARRLH